MQHGGRHNKKQIEDVEGRKKGKGGGEEKEERDGGDLIAWMTVRTLARTQMCCQPGFFLQKVKGEADLTAAAWVL